MGREGETPAQIFWHIGVQKKWYKLSKSGGGRRGNLDKIQKNSYFFLGDLPLVTFSRTGLPYSLDFLLVPAASLKMLGRSS